MNNKDWAHQEASKIIDKWLLQLQRGEFSLELSNDIAEHLNEAAAIEWPTTEETISQSFKAKAQAEAQGEDLSYQIGFSDGIIWLKHYIRSSRTVSKDNT